MKSKVFLLIVVLIFSALFLQFNAWQEESFLHTGGMSVKAHPWESKMYIFPGGDTLYLNVSGETGWREKDLRVRIAPGGQMKASSFLKQKSVAGWIGEKDFGSIRAQMAVSGSGNEANVTLTNSQGKGMDVWLIEARTLFNGTVRTDSVEGEFRGKIVVIPF